MKNISPCLWFDKHAEEAVNFYELVFKNFKKGRVSRYGKSGSEVSGQKEGSVMTISFQIEDLEIEALNGGPLFKFTPALSFFVSCASKEEIQLKWQQLSQGGTVRMGLDKYPWAEQYGWVADQYGVDWQLILAPSNRKIVPSFLFVEQLFGQGEEALQFYTSLFPKSKIEAISKDENTNTVMHATFSLNNQGFALMEGQGKHEFTFSSAFSLIVNCENQEEIDQLWDKLSPGGVTEQCGWIKDKYGVSWQIIPHQLGALMANPEKSEKVMKAMLKMKKLDLATLEAAAR